MSIAASELERVARLARLRLAPDEMARLAEQLGDILGHIDELLAIDIEPDQAAPLAPEPVAAQRPDIPDADPLLRPIAEIAPAWREGFFTVPRVLAP